MALHKPPLEVPFIDMKTGHVTEPWVKWLIIAQTDKVDKVSGGTEDNIVVLDSDGNSSDSGVSLPTGDIVGTTDTQTLTNKTLTSPTIADLTNMTHDHTSAAEGGDYAWADMTLAETQADASTSHSITDPGDAPADADALRDDLVANTIPSIESALNALGTIINALIDKLQAANLMT